MNVIATLVTFLLALCIIFLHISVGIPRDLVIYTDGSEYKDKYGFGVFAGYQSTLNCTILCQGEMSSYVAELQAVIQTLDYLMMIGRCRDTLFFATDLLFTVIGLQTFIKEKGEKLPLEDFNYDLTAFYNQHLDYLAIIYLLSRSFKAVYIFHVPAHKGIAQNEMADILAKLAVSKEENLEKAFEKAALINLDQRKCDMDYDRTVRYCKIDGQFTPKVEDHIFEEIRYQPMHDKHDLNELEGEDSIWKELEMSPALDEDMLTTHLKRGDPIKWSQLLKQKDSPAAIIPEHCY